eukprot:19179-Heterococcus_DN1.PRE.3
MQTNVANGVVSYEVIVYKSLYVRAFCATCQTMMLLSIGAPVTPEGGSFCSLRKSRIKRRRAEVDMAALCLSVLSCAYCTPALPRFTRVGLCVKCRSPASRYNE